MQKRSGSAVLGAPARSKKGRHSSPDQELGNLRPLAKSADPAYLKFTTYIRKTTHLGVKTRLVSKQMEFSDLVEQLLADWLKENEAIVA